MKHRMLVEMIRTLVRETIRESRGCGSDLDELGGYMLEDDEVEDEPKKSRKGGVPLSDKEREDFEQGFLRGADDLDEDDDEDSTTQKSSKSRDSEDDEETMQRVRDAYLSGWDDLDEDEEKKDEKRAVKGGVPLSDKEREDFEAGYLREDEDDELDETVSKKGAEAQLKSLGRKTFKGKAAKVRRDMPGIENPEAFVASRMDRAHGKGWRKEDREEDLDEELSARQIKKSLGEKDRAKEIWKRAKSGGSLSKEDRSFMNSMYYDGRLPRDPDYSVEQWVEDGMPSF